MGKLPPGMQHALQGNLLHKNPLRIFRGLKGIDQVDDFAQLADNG
jgi:hypothetical protein